MSRQALTLPQVDEFPAAPGWYGKVVLLGDFAHRRLSQGFITVCDQWLSRGISASRLQLGSSWLDIYLTGPVWRFAWAPGVVDDSWWFGVMMPSVDAVGRYFPLVVSSSDQNPPMSIDACNQLSRWYSHAGQAALATLRPGASVDGFEAELARAPQWQDAATAQPEVETTAERQRFLLGGTPSLARWVHTLASPLFTQRYARHSFWFAFPADGRDDALTVVPGLPDPDQFSLMLEGRW